MLSKALAVSALLVVGAAQGFPARPPITVSAAVSLTDALTAIAQEYGKTGGGTIRFNFGASNVLARQIVSGAPVDLFISADELQMDLAEKAGMMKDGTRVDVVANQLAVVVPSDRPRTFTSMRDLLAPALRRIAIGDPAGVPAGVYAKQYLERLGLWTTLQPRMVPSSSVRSALNAVEAGAADAAIVYRTDARTSSRASVSWVVPASEGPRIVYPAAIVKSTSSPDEAARFLDFVRGAAAARVFERFGFTPIR